jgi:hypothetical protein
MPPIAKKCAAGHSMTAQNTQQRREHGVVAEECRECVRLKKRIRDVYGYTRGEQAALAKHEVEVEDTSQMRVCPKCSGKLIYGTASHYEDTVYCFHCGWRPSARVGQEGTAR